MSRNYSGATRAALSFAVTAAMAGALAGCSQQAPMAEDEGLALGALGAPDIEANKIYGVVCGFREAGGSIRALALIQPEQAWVKLDGFTSPLPLKSGEGEGPLGIGLTYGNEAAVLSLTPKAEERVSGGGRTEVESGLTLRTSDGGFVELDGILQCSAGSV